MRISWLGAGALCIVRLACDKTQVAPYEPPPTPATKAVEQAATPAPPKRPAVGAHVFLYDGDKPSEMFPLFYSSKDMHAWWHAVQAKDSAAMEAAHDEAMMIRGGVEAAVIDDTVTDGPTVKILTGPHAQKTAWGAQVYMHGEQDPSLVVAAAKNGDPPATFLELVTGEMLDPTAYASTKGGKLDQRLPRVQGCASELTVPDGAPNGTALSLSEPDRCLALLGGKRRFAHRSFEGTQQSADWYVFSDPRLVGVYLLQEMSRGKVDTADLFNVRAICAGYPGGGAMEPLLAAPETKDIKCPEGKAP